jgi:hypothetical protein
MENGAQAHDERPVIVLSKVSGHIFKGPNDGRKNKLWVLFRPAEARVGEGVLLCAAKEQPAMKVKGGGAAASRPDIDADGAFALRHTHPPQ